MPSRPLIGVTTSRHLAFTAWLFDWFSVVRAGGRPVRLVPGDEDSQSARNLDGLIIGGGDDISASLYGGEVLLDVRIDPARDSMELALLNRYSEGRIPILGVCRGSQMMNIFRGGTLVGDIHEKNPEIPRMRTVLPRKRVSLESNSRLSKILGLKSCRVNSIHHQAVDRLGDGLRSVAFDRHGVVQAIEDDGLPFFIGVQWHPEFLVANPSQRRLFDAFVKAAKNGAG